MSIHNLLKITLREHNFDCKNNHYLILLAKYISLISEWNKRINLISDTDVNKIIKRHILDSLYVMKLNIVSQCETILDIGSGAGFPGMIINIYTNKDTTLIESNSKKAFFLQLVKQRLGLKNLTVINKRAEDLSKSYVYREKYDCIISRALANFPISMELSFPFSKINGNIIYFSTKKSNKIIEKYFNKIKIFGCEKYNLYPYVIDNVKYYLFCVKKLWKTPDKYPRSYNKMQKNTI